MQLSNILAVALAACGAVSAAPAPDVHAAALEARAWPANGVASSWGTCHESGRWGQRPEAIRAIQEFCNKHAKGQKLTTTISESFKYNTVYRWDLKIRNYGSSGNPLSYIECTTNMLVGLDYCPTGKNTDTRFVQIFFATYSTSNTVWLTSCLAGALEPSMTVATGSALTPTMAKPVLASPFLRGPRVCRGWDRQGYGSHWQSS